MTPFARLARLSCRASAIASAIAEKAAIIPAVDMPSELATTMTSARYKTTVIIDITNVAAALSSLLFIAERRTIESTAFTITSPKSANATVRAITSPPS